MYTITEVGTSVVLKGEVGSPRIFSTGSVGWNISASIMLGGIKHQLSANVVVNKSKAWDDETKLAWQEGRVDKTFPVEAIGTPDTFQSGNTGWRFNTQTYVDGRNCTVSGSLVLSKKTIERMEAKKEKIAAKIKKQETAVEDHKAALLALKKSIGLA